MSHMKGNHSIQMRWKWQLTAVNYIQTQDEALGRCVPQNVLTLATITKTQEKLQNLQTVILVWQSSNSEQKEL